MILSNVARKDTGLNGQNGLVARHHVLVALNTVAVHTHAMLKPMLNNSHVASMAPGWNGHSTHYVHQLAWVALSCVRDSTHVVKQQLPH